MTEQYTDHKNARALLDGRIIFNNLRSTFACSITRLSPTGAVLRLGSTFAVPQAFILEAQPTRTRHNCVIVGRTRSAIEVRFVPPVQAVG